MRDEKGRRTVPINSLLLVPHRDLAYQIYHWIERIHHHMPDPPPLSSLAQVLVRDSTVNLEERVKAIQQDPPHILIGTPQAVYDVVQSDQAALPLERLSTVVVDEVDYLIESVPVISDKYALMKIERRIHKHPGPTRLLLNHIYSTENYRRKDSYQMFQMHNPRGEDHRRDDSRGAPQLVMMSATLRNHLKRFLLADSGWFTKEPGMLVRITGDASAHYPKGLKNPIGAEDRAAFSVGGTGLQHHVLVVTEDGSVANIHGATDVAETQRSNHATASPQVPAQIPPSSPPALAQTDDVEAFGTSCAALPSHALIAVSTYRRAVSI